MRKLATGPTSFHPGAGVFKTLKNLSVSLYAYLARPGLFGRLDNTYLPLRSASITIGQLVSYLGLRPGSKASNLPLARTSLARIPRIAWL
jgi:hypothetical protein